MSAILVRENLGGAINLIEAAAKADDPPTLVASSEAIRSRLGWEPRVPSLEEIIQTAWAWHESHPRGYDR